jgi:hypothetical protein
VFRSSDRTTFCGRGGWEPAALAMSMKRPIKPTITKRIIATKAPAIDRKKVLMTGAIPLLVLESGLSRLSILLIIDKK